MFAGIVAICKSVSLYGSRHPFVHQQCQRLTEALQSNLGPERPTLSFNIHKGELYCEDSLMPEEGTRFAAFLVGLSDLNIGSISLQSDLSVAEATEALASLVTALQTIDQRPTGSASLSEKVTGTQHLTFATLALRPAGMKAEKDATVTLTPNGPQVYDAAVRAADSALSEVGKGELPDLEQVSESVSAMVESVLDDESSLLSLTAIKQHDEYTAYHSVNVSVIAVALAARLGLNTASLLAIGRGAILHDIGKVRIDKAVIAKKGPLDSSEWSRMRAHPDEGVKFLCRLAGIDEATLAIVYEHHVGYDLSGYPADFGLDKQHFYAAIVQVADVYDGITSKRPYHPAHSPHQALRLVLQNGGKLFHPLIVKEFAQMIGVYPSGSRVLLADGRLATATSQTKGDTLHPTVRTEDGSGPGRGCETLVPGSVEIVELAAADG